MFTATPGYSCGGQQSVKPRIILSALDKTATEYVERSGGGISAGNCQGQPFQSGCFGKPFNIKSFFGVHSAKVVPIPKRQRQHDKVFGAWVQLRRLGRLHAELA